MKNTLALIEASEHRRRLIVETRACLVLAGVRMGRGRRQSTANDENKATAATAAAAAAAAAALLRNE